MSSSSSSADTQATPLQGGAHPINNDGWSDAYPAPTTTSFDALDPATLAGWIQQGSKVAGVDYLVIDVRRADCEYLIPGAINLPAHSFYPALPSLLPLLARIPILIFHCGNRNTRGTRCAAWLADALKQAGKGHEDSVKIYTLQGGYSGWQRQYGVRPIKTRGQRPPPGSLQAVPL